eukprot:m.284364 g.284364  ORF g.284364 m.284364 type:complete len:440 (+) comp19423_c0_seq11:2104-3423(+)
MSAGCSPSLPSKMRAAVFASASHHAQGIHVQQCSVPTPHRRGRALVRTRAAGVNPVDAKFLIGDKVPRLIDGMCRWFVRGYTAGIDFAGEVVEAPEDSGFSCGDAVYGTMPPTAGSFSEFVSVPLHQLARKPEGLTFAEASVLPLSGLTCVQAFEQHHLVAGQRLLVIGASGGVGHLAVQIATAMGAVVTGICSTRNLAFVRGLGAAHVIDYTDAEHDVIDALKDIVASDGMFHMVLDTVSSNDARDSSHSYQTRIRNSNPPVVFDHKRDAAKAHPKRASHKHSGDGHGSDSSDGSSAGSSAASHHSGSATTVTATADDVAPAGDVGDIDPHNYVTIGGTPWAWVQAGAKRVLGLNTFGAGHELFWVRFPYSQHELERLTAMVERGALRPTVQAILPFDDDGVQEAFRRLHTRKARGKLTLAIAIDTPQPNQSQQEKDT